MQGSEPGAAPDQLRPGGAAARRLDYLTAAGVAAYLAGDRAIIRLGGANVGGYFSNLSQHIPKPRRVLANEAVRYLGAVAATIAAALAELREYAGQAGALAARTGLR